ncbi:hypothetical protein P152DRAFT_483041 [Eremomyces bilateralis CBS 781.70]|uniref:Concanavalin A-like lectin/glucanase n=1 Tax=Eremomyces bilateralis CBS 781.70 TaxID=1392243 RepID=A0A6G1G0Q4_9PEZI|nr:uncharacterized protein P152DRAFT_483041 [Eremomyces bilateralis CBS 781.70]KAF1811598.1 hypothetical protein P152DRAFT_483041 [Eremomyces bilateralis CBS 781.70]
MLHATTLLLLPLAAIAAPLESRQHDHGAATGGTGATGGAAGAGSAGAAGGSSGLAGLLGGSGGEGGSSGLAGLFGKGSGSGGSGGLAGLLGGGSNGSSPFAGLFGGGDPLTPFKTYELEPKIRKDAKRVKYAWGPYELLGASADKPAGSFSMDPNGQSFMSSVTGVAGPAAVLAGKVGLMYEDGCEANIETGIYTHHILTRATGKKDVPFVGRCPTEDGKPANSSSGLSSLLAGLNIGSGFIGAGEDNGNEPNMYTNSDGTYPSAFNIAAGEKFSAQLDLVNYKETTQKLYITFDIEYLEGSAENDATSALLSVTGCGADPIATSKDGPASTKSKKWGILSDGYIVSAKGHLHDGGDKMVLFLNDKEVCTSEAIYGGAGGTTTINGKEWEMLNGMSQCSNSIAVKAGDYISMEAFYDLAKHPLREDQGGAGHDDGHSLGIMGMFSLSYAAGGASSNSTAA